MKAKSIMIAAIAFAITAFARPQAAPPDACATLPPEDIAAVLGAGWTQTPSSMAAHLADLVSCSYTKGVGNMVAFSLNRAPGNNAKVAVPKRMENVKVKHPVTLLPDICEGGFSYASTKTITTLVAAKGAWEVQINVIIENKPDTASEAKLAVRACKRMS
jgi:hypothetical protein